MASIATLKEGVVDYVIFSGMDESYPGWFTRELDRGLYEDESRYIRYLPPAERNVDYYDKTIIEDYSVFLRKDNGDVHCTSYDTFESLYLVLEHNSRTNSGVAGFREDCIEIVECHGGVPGAYPSWFFDYFKDGITIESEEETILFYDDIGEISLTGYSVFLRNKYNEIAHMDGETFDKFYIKQGIRRL